MHARHSWILVSSLAALAGITGAAAEPPNLGKVIEAQQDDPAVPGIEIGAADLEEIRTVVIRYYEEKKPEHWEVFVEELKTGGIFSKEEFPQIGPSIGNWKCETDKDGILLVRDPGLTESGEPMSIYFYVRLVKKDGRWTAIEHSYREVRWQRVPSEDPPPTPQSFPPARWANGNVQHCADQGVSTRSNLRWG